MFPCSPSKQASSEPYKGTWALTKGPRWRPRSEGIEIRSKTHLRNINKPENLEPRKAA